MYKNEQIVRKATHSEIPEIVSLWQEVFSDAPAYVKRFIAHFGIENCYVCEIEGKIAAMAFTLPTSLFCRSNALPVRYVYACATRLQYQKQGIMAKLLTTVYNEACSENSTALFLRPADEHLAKYYRKLGFQDFFYQKCLTFNRKERKERAKVAIEFLTPNTYYNKRVQKLDNNCFVNWNEDFFRFLKEDKMQFCEYENAIFSFKIENSMIIVDEFLGDTADLPIINSLFEYYTDIETIKVILLGNDICCGQMRWCKPVEQMPQHGYFAFGME